MSAVIPTTAAVDPVTVENFGKYFFINTKASIIPGIAVPKLPYSNAWCTSSAILSAGVSGNMFNSFFSS